VYLHAVVVTGASVKKFLVLTQNILFSLFP
jgi:hypothetical protein